MYWLHSLALQNVTVIHNHLLLWDKQKPKMCFFIFTGSSCLGTQAGAWKIKTLWRF